MRFTMIYHYLGGFYWSMFVGVAIDRHNLHVKIKTEFRTISCHGWLGFFVKRYSLEYESWPQSHLLLATFWHWFCPRPVNLKSLNGPCALHHLCTGAGFLHPGPQISCNTRDSDVDIPSTLWHANRAIEHPRFTDDVSELNFHWKDSQPHLVYSETHFQGVRGREGEMGRVEAGKGAGDGWRVDGTQRSVLQMSFWLWFSLSKPGGQRSADVASKNGSLQWGFPES